jgi:hypothetical protein
LVTVALNLRKSDSKPTKSSRRGSASLCGYATRVYAGSGLVKSTVQLFTQSYNRLSGCTQAQFSLAGLCIPGWRFPIQIDCNDLILGARSFRKKVCGQPAFLVSAFFSFHLVLSS